MNYKMSRRILEICCWVMLALASIGLAMELLLPSIASIVIMAAGVIQYLIFGRCPHCGTLFNSRVRLPRYCPECGKELE